MRRWVFWFACVLALGSSSVSFGQDPSGPRTLENLLKSDDAEKSAASAEADAGDAGPKRPAGTVARPKDGVQHPDLDKAWADYDAAVLKASEDIRAAISKQLDAATAKGDLDAAEKWQKVGKKFEEAGALPSDNALDKVVKDAAAIYKKAKEKLTKAYDSVVKALTMEKKIAEAKLFRNEKDKLVASPNLQPTDGAKAVPRPDPEWEDVTSDLVGGKRGDDVVISPAGAKVVSSKRYSPPVEIEYVCATSRNNIRLGYASDGLIFNWENNRNELRIDGGPVGGQHVMNAGAVPVGRMVTIRQLVIPTGMAVFVDGQKRASWLGDFSQINELIEIFSPDSNLYIKSVRVRKKRS